MKTAVVLPGYPHDIHERKYESIATMLRSAGYQVQEHGPDWSAGSVERWVETVLASMPNPSGDVMLVGFSMGAMVALIIASRVPVDGLILCSPSGYFQEYAQYMSQEDVEWARANIAEFDALSVGPVLGHLQARHGIVLAGSKELAAWPDFKIWTRDLCDRTHWELRVISETDHDIGDPRYQAALSGVIAELREAAE